MDPSVSRAKFEREVEEYRARESDYRRRGWFLARAEFPEVLVAMATPQTRPPSIVTGVALDFTNYDARPPSVRLVNPFTGEPYRFKDLPTMLSRVGQVGEVPIPGLGLRGGAGILLQPVQPLMQAHAPDDVPFLCLAGVREYHDHPGHSGDSWELHRTAGGGRLVRLLSIIDQYGVKPIRGFHVNLVPQVGFEFGEPPA